MNIDFSAVLLVLVAFCGGLWLADWLWLRPRRMAAHARNADIKAHEPLFIEYAKAFFPVLLLVFLLRAFVAEPFRIPTGSMIPSLQVGDYILVNKYAYGLRLPLIGTKIWDVGSPQRGEVMVFIPPHEDSYYIKRVIGLPGDTVRYEEQRLYINGELVPQQPMGPVQVDTSIGDLPGTMYTESLGETPHNIQHIQSAAPGSLRNSWIVPPGQYFMMGDNRDNSADSRVWGPASEEEIVGKAVAIWVHKQPGWSMPSFARNQWLP